MNAAHLHIVLNHIPVIGVPFAAALLVYGLVRKSEEVKRAGLLALIIIALVTVPTYLSGQAAEDIVERLPGVEHDIIERHEDAALVALIATSALGAVALAVLVKSFATGALGRVLTTLMILLSFGVAGWLGRTANLGGKIRHTELRSGAAPAEEADEAEEDDDEGGRGRGRSRNRRGRSR